MYLGIDFGTSFSQGATTSMGEPVLLLPNGFYGIPSSFYYDSEVGILIGSEADDEGQGLNAINLKREIKMELYNNFTADGRTFTAEEIVRNIYKYIIKMSIRIAQQKYIPGADEIEGVVISVPASFTMQETDLIKRACMSAVEGEENIPVLGVLKEPVAAALSYFKTPGEQNNNVLVYDLGGGTCDVALLQSDQGSIEHYTVADSDMVRIGGCRWDDELINYIANVLSEQKGENVRLNPAYMEKIRSAAVEAKHSLSEVEVKNVRIEMDGMVYKVSVTRADFEAMTKYLLDETINLLVDVYKRNINSCNITDVICVGGSSLMPQVYEAISKALPRCNISIFSPETAVANGAAIYADIIKDRVDTLLPITDIAAFSYGVRVYADYSQNDMYEIISNVIIKGNTLPMSGQSTFHTVNGGGDVIIRIYENSVEDEICELEEAPAEPIGRIKLTLPKFVNDNYDVHVEMKLTPDKELVVEAYDDFGNVVESSFKLDELKRD